MTAPRIDTVEAHAQALARNLLAGIAAAETAGRFFLLGCPTGRTPMPVYKALATHLEQHGQSLKPLVLVMMDEYVLGGGEPKLADPAAHYSCQGFALRDIRARLNAPLSVDQQLPLENIWFADPADPAAFDQHVTEAGGIDFFILASGAGDGHVAFNPPGSDRQTQTRILELAEQTRIDNMGTFPGFRTLDDVPRRGISVGIDTIARARAGAMLLFGEGKAKAFQRISAASGYDANWPATIIHDLADGVILADAAAASGR